MIGRGTVRSVDHVVAPDDRLAHVGDHRVGVGTCHLHSEPPHGARPCATSGRWLPCDGRYGQRSCRRRLWADRRRGRITASQAGQAEHRSRSAGPDARTDRRREHVHGRQRHHVHAVRAGVISGNPKDGLFVGVVVSNSVIGVIQEVRARRELRRLEVVTEPLATVRAKRDRRSRSRPTGSSSTTSSNSGSAAQVAVDGTVLASTGLRLDESMLTGESLPVGEGVGDEVLSGSFVVGGNGSIRATAVGADSYASTLATEAKRFTTSQSTVAARDRHDPALAHADHPGRVDLPVRQPPLGRGHAGRTRCSERWPLRSPWCPTGSCC